MTNDYVNHWQLATMSGRLAHVKTAPVGAACGYLLFSYAFFRRANPIKPINPEPNNQTAGGTGTSVP